MVEMKDSNIEWIGNIPKHWGICKVKNGFYQKKSKACQEEPVVLSLARAGVKVRDITTNEGQLASSYYEYNPVTINDILINPMDLVSGANCSLSKVEGVISPAYINLRYKIGYNPQYYNYYFKYQYWSKAFFTYGKGVSFDNRWTINNETLMRFPLLHPPLYEQNKIAEFLDEKCAEIDSISAEIQEQINTLEEYKKSVITEAVTKGLNPNVEMKDSGIEWIGQIPNNWTSTRLGVSSWVRARLGWKGLRAEEYVEEGHPFLSAFNIVNNKVSWKDLNYINNERYDESPEIKLSISDIIIVKDGAGIGKCARINSLPFGTATTNSSLGVITTYRNLSNLYLYYYLQCAIFQNLIFRMINGMGVPHLTQETLRKIVIPLPTINEQKQITDFLDSKCLEIDSAIEDKQKQLKILDEYKKTLIYEYVTGKKEVA